MKYFTTYCGRGFAKLKTFQKNEYSSPHPPTPLSKLFLNPSPTWTGHSHHYDYLTTLNNIYTTNIHVWYTTPPPPTSPYIFTCSHYFRTIFKKKNQNESWTNPLTHFQSYLAFFEFFLTLLVIKINFFLEYSCFCIFCAEDDPGTTQKKWQQRFSRLDMYFGGNNHGCQEYSKNVYKYTQADRL